MVASLVILVLQKARTQFKSKNMLPIIRAQLLDWQLQYSNKCSNINISSCGLCSVRPQSLGVYVGSLNKGRVILPLVFYLEPPQMLEAQSSKFQHEANLHLFVNSVGIFWIFFLNIPFQELGGLHSTEVAVALLTQRASRSNPGSVEIFFYCLVCKHQRNQTPSSASAWDFENAVSGKGLSLVLQKTSEEFPDWNLRLQTRVKSRSFLEATGFGRIKCFPRH